MDDIIKMLKALSDETRLRMIMLIEQQELCVCEIVYILKMKQSRVSRHLNILSDAGLVRSRRQGTWMFYSPAIYNTKYHSHILEALKGWMENKEMVKRDLVNLAKC